MTDMCKWGVMGSLITGTQARHSVFDELPASTAGPRCVSASIALGLAWCGVGWGGLLRRFVPSL